MFSERHYEWLARWMAGVIASKVANGRFIAISLADALELNNPLFDRAKFLKACGVDQ